MLPLNFANLCRCTAPARWRCYSSLAPTQQQVASSSRASSTDDNIAVNSPLQDLFLRLAQGQEAKTEHSDVQPSIQNEEMRAAGRPWHQSASALKQLSKPSSFPPSSVAMLAAKFGESHHYHRFWHRMAAMLLQHPERFLYRMSPEEITKVAWGYAQVKIHEPQLFKEIEHHARRCINVFTPNQLSRLAWALSEVRHAGSRGLMEVIARQAEARMAEFVPRDLAKLLKTLGDHNELTLPLLVRFLPSLSVSLETLKTPVLLQALGAVAAAVARQRPSTKALQDHMDLVTTFLHTAAPIVLERASQRCRDWELEVGSAKRMSELLWLQREWQDWAAVQNLYRTLADPQDKLAVQEALARLEQQATSATNRD